MKKPAILPIVLLMTLTACSEKGKEPPEETDVINETIITTSAQTVLEITETQPKTTSEASLMIVPEETLHSITEAVITEVSHETTSSAAEIESEPVRKERITLTVTQKTEAYIIGTLNEDTVFADKGEAILINVPEGQKIEVSNIIEVELDDTAEITDTLLETPEGERETGSLQINGGYTLRLVSDETVSETAITSEPTESALTESETITSPESETAVTERNADIAFKVHMTGAYEGELLEDTFFGKTGDRFMIRLDDSYAVMSTPDTDAVITLWSGAYIGYTDSLIINASDIYTITPAE